MEQGFTVDLVSGDSILGARYVSKWARGSPLKSFFFGVWVPRDWMLPIGTYRCQSCGYLESYARAEFAGKTQTQFSLRSLFVLITIVAVLLGLIVFLSR
jgi:hypothetical protein